MMDHMAEWLRFFVWGLAGACLALGVTALGVFTFPLGLVVVVWLMRTRRSGREALGLLEGAGAVVVLVGALNLDYRSCASGPVFLHSVRGGSSCGGVEGLSWLVVGAVVMLLAAVAYGSLRWTGRNSPPEGIA